MRREWEEALQKWAGHPVEGVGPQVEEGEVEEVGSLVAVEEEEAEGSQPSSVEEEVEPWVHQEEAEVAGKPHFHPLGGRRKTKKIYIKHYVHVTHVFSSKNANGKTKRLPVTESYSMLSLSYIKVSTSSTAHSNIVDPRGQIQDLLPGRAKLYPLPLEFVLHLVQSLHHVILFLSLSFTLPLLPLQLSQELYVI